MFNSRHRAFRWRLFFFADGIGELKPEDAKRFLKTGARTNEVPTVRPLGLFLWRVDY